MKSNKQKERTSLDVVDLCETLYIKDINFNLKMVLMVSTL